MPKNSRTLNHLEANGARSRTGKSKIQSSPTPSMAGSQLQLPPGEPDIEALRSATREWLVPRLVQKFLRIHGVELKHSRKFRTIENRLPPALSEEGSLTSAGAVSQETGTQANKKKPLPKA